MNEFEKGVIALAIMLGIVFMSGLLVGRYACQT